MFSISVHRCSGRIVPLSETPWSGLADAISTVAQEGEEALLDWFLPIHRPLFDDVEISTDGAILLHEMSLIVEGT